MTDGQPPIYHTYEVEYFRFSTGASYKATEFNITKQNPPVERWEVANDGAAALRSLFEAETPEDAIRLMMNRIAHPKWQDELQKAVLARYGFGS